MYEILCDFEVLYKSYLLARRGKRWKAAEARFEYGALEAVLMLQTMMINHEYKPSPLNRFYVHEPKLRLVQAPCIKDKVVLHAVCDNILYEAFTKSFIRDSYASQIGKGVHDGLDRLKCFMHRYYKEHGTADGWVLKADVSKFFASIPHDHLKLLCAECIDDEEVLEVLYSIIDATDGLPLGFQSSQLFALKTLDRLDHMIKEKYRVKYYGRYMDDFFIIHEDKAFLQRLLTVITEELGKIGLFLNAKTHIFPLRNGIDFLGFHTYLCDDGRVIRKLRRASKERMRRKLKVYGKLYKEGKITKEEIDMSYKSWRAHAEHGNCYHLIQKFDAIYADIFKEV